MSSEQVEPPVTGDEGVDEALDAVARLADRPLEEHPEVLRQAQVALQQFLSSPVDAS